MSVRMKIFLTHNINYENEFHVSDILTPDQDYAFYGHIVDMSSRLDNDPQIPLKPVVDVTKLDYTTNIVILPDGREDLFGKKEMFFCLARQFVKISVDELDTSQKNKAIILFLKALPEDTQVLVKMSW